MSKINVIIYKSQFNQSIKVYEWFKKKGRVSIEDRGIGEIKGLYYDINIMSIGLAELYYKQYLENLYFVKFLNKSMRTDKFSYYIKKSLSYNIYDVLNGLYLNNVFLKGNKIAIINSPLNRYVLNSFCDDKNIKYDIRWMNLNYLYCFMPFMFLALVLKRILINGFTYRDKINVKLYKYAVWGLDLPILRDDYMIDDVTFKKEDIVFYVDHRDDVSKIAGDQLKKRGYSVIDMNSGKLNSKNGLTLFVNIFIVCPLMLSNILFYEKTGYLLEDMLKFYWVSLPHYLFLTNYNAKCHISTSDHGEIAETILMNRLGCKNSLYHWSDMTVAKAVTHAYTVHDIYFTWGPIHHDFQNENYYHDKVEVVGCMLLQAYFDALIAPEQGIKIKTSKRILICDNSFSNTLHLSEDVYLDYLDLIINMMTELTDAEFIFKSKNTYENFKNIFTCELKKISYTEKMSRLFNDKRFSYYDYKTPIETLIALSALVINMSMNSPGTIALIVGKEAVYYDITGNNMHPFTQYKNQIVFDNKRMLINHVKDVLDNKKSAFDYIDPDLLNQYEPYKDSKARVRLIRSIYKETNTTVKT